MPNRTTRARTAGTTRRTRRRQVPAVNTISTARRNRKPTQDDIAGQIMWLPSPAEVICDTPLVLDEGCFNHPVLILSSCPDKNKHVRILIVGFFFFFFSLFPPLFWPYLNIYLPTYLPYPLHIMTIVTYPPFLPPTCRSRPSIPPRSPINTNAAPPSENSTCQSIPLLPMPIWMVMFYTWKETGSCSKSRT